MCQHQDIIGSSEIKVVRDGRVNCEIEDEGIHVVDLAIFS